jgi:hypothetical protein
VAVVPLVHEEHVVDLGLLGLSRDREDRLLADVLGLVGDPVERVEDHEQREQIAERPRRSLPELDQVGEGAREEVGRARHALGAARHLRVALVERPQRFGEDTASVVRVLLHIQGDLAGRCARELHRLA